MKSVILVIFWTSLTVQAAETESQKHEKFKRGMLEALDGKIANLTATRKCYEKSKSMDDSNKCRDEMTNMYKEKENALKAKRKALNAQLEKKLPQPEAKAKKR